MDNHENPRLEDVKNLMDENKLEQQYREGLDITHSELDSVLNTTPFDSIKAPTSETPIHVSLQMSQRVENAVSVDLSEPQDGDDNALPSEVTRMSFSPDLDEKCPLKLYEIISQVGEGTFGKVFKARNIISGNYVALKRIRMEGEKDGFPVTAMREIKLLQSLDHINVIRLYEMMVSQGQWGFRYSH